MICPNCGSNAGFQVCQGFGACGGTGYNDGEYLRCLECHAETDAEELYRIGAAIESKSGKEMAA